MNIEHTKALLQEADLGIDEAFKIGYELGYAAVSAEAAYGIENRFEGYGDDLEIAFNKGISIGFIDKCFDLDQLDAGATIH